MIWPQIISRVLVYRKDCLPSHWRMASARMNSLAWAFQRPVSSSVAFQSAVTAFCPRLASAGVCIEQQSPGPGVFSQDGRAAFLCTGAAPSWSRRVFPVPSSLLPPRIEIILRSSTGCHWVGWFAPLHIGFHVMAPAALTGNFRWEKGCRHAWKCLAEVPFGSGAPSLLSSLCFLLASVFLFSALGVAISFLLIFPFHPAKSDWLQILWFEPVKCVPTALHVPRHIFPRAAGNSRLQAPCLPSCSSITLSGSEPSPVLRRGSSESRCAIHGA